jgi:hypothetical protein
LQPGLSFEQCVSEVQSFDISKGNSVRRQVEKANAYKASFDDGFNDTQLRQITAIVNAVLKSNGRSEEENSSTDLSKVKCRFCRKYGHYKSDCDQLAKKRERNEPEEVTSKGKRSKRGNSSDDE